MIRLLRSLPGLVFGLLFATGGLFILSETALPTWQNWRAMQNWQLTYAQLLSASGEETQTRARYRYDYDGNSYQGDRVYVAEFNDNIGSYHTDLLNRLHSQLNAGEPIPVWVNPLIPQQVKPAVKKSIGEYTRTGARRRSELVDHDSVRQHSDLME